jgi:hypothetical protein
MPKTNFLNLTDSKIEICQSDLNRIKESCHRMQNYAILFDVSYPKVSKLAIHFIDAEILKIKCILAFYGF